MPISSILAIDTKKEKLFRTSLEYSEPGSNRYGHYCPQDFKSGVSTYSTIRATQSVKDVANVQFLFYFTKNLYVFDSPIAMFSPLNIKG